MSNAACSSVTPRRASPELSETRIGASGEVGLLPPPLGGAGVGGGRLERLYHIVCPLPVPPPARGGGDDVARPVVTARLTQSARLRADFGSARCTAERRGRVWDLPRSGAAP